MNKKDQLKSEYEDAMTALLLNQIAQEEGSRLIAENTQLIQDDKIPPSDTFTHRCVQELEQYGKKKQHRQRAARIIHRCKYISIVILLLLFCLSVLLCFSESFRIKTFNFVLEVKEDGPFYWIEDLQRKASYIPLDWKAIPLPDGYEPYNVTDNGGCWAFRKGDNTIEIMRTDADHPCDLSTYENENASISYTQICGVDVLIQSRNNVIRMQWQDPTHLFLFQLDLSDSANVDGLDIVESIILQYQNQ